MADKRVQILLRENVPVEKQVIDYLTTIGSRTGTEKRLLIEGVLALINGSQAPVMPVTPKPVQTQTYSFEMPQEHKPMLESEHAKLMQNQNNPDWLAGG